MEKIKTTIVDSVVNNKKPIMIRITSISVVSLLAITLSLTTVPHEFENYINDFFNNPNQLDKLLQCFIQNQTNLNKMGPCLFKLFESDVSNAYLELALIATLITWALNILLSYTLIELPKNKNTIVMDFLNAPILILETFLFKPVILNMFFNYLNSALENKDSQILNCINDSNPTSCLSNLFVSDVEFYSRIIAIVAIAATLLTEQLFNQVLFTPLYKLAEKQCKESSIYKKLASNEADSPDSPANPPLTGAASPIASPVAAASADDTFLEHSHHVVSPTAAATARLTPH